MADVPDGFAQRLRELRKDSGARALSTQEDPTMNATTEELLINRIRSLSPEQVAEVSDFVEFLASRSARRAAFDRLLTIAPAIEAAGAEPITEEEILAEVRAAISNSSAAPC